MKLEIVYLPTESLTPYENNAKIHTEEQIEQIVKSIQEFGMNDPIGIWGENNLIIEGHGRLEACKKLGMKEVPCIRLDDLTDEQRRAYTLAHNQLTMNTGFDLDMLQAELDNIIDIDMSDFGFKDAEPEFDINDDDFDINEVDIPEPITKAGDIYKLGEHRLMCGDSTSEEDVDKLIRGGYADLLVTDPPYNVNYEGGDGQTIQNDDMPEDQFLLFLLSAFSQAHRVLKEGGAFYIWHAETTSGAFRRATNEALGQVRQTLIWNKNAFVMGRQDYQWKHEACLYGWKEGAGHYFVDDRTQATVIEDKGFDINKLSKDELKKLLKDMLSDKVSTTILNEDKPQANREHPTMKPIKLIARLIKNSSRQGETVLDLFGGSGSTMIACEQLNRKCVTMELDPHYCDVIVKRWEDFTGKKAEKVN